MSSQPSSPEPAFTRVQLTGPPGEVDRLMAVLASMSEVVFDSRSEPDARGDVSCVAQVLTHPSPAGPVADGRVSVTVQAVLEADAQALPGLPDAAAAQRVEESVSAALVALPGVTAVASRLVAAVGVPGV
ncbi:hypothetical protein ACIF70_40490 [Actinacidiphila glaucinigra]|uniref:hypothetical protein n=1 Tax=Actinacidiphila glaucinigra TaxID=235986 RepID=UPI0037CC64CF